MDYLSAVSVIGYTLIVAIIRTMNVKVEASRVMIASPIIAFVATHMLYLNLLNFDYGTCDMLCFHVFKVKTCIDFDFVDS